MKGKGVAGTITWILSVLFFIGLFLAVLAQFDGDLGAMFSWTLELMWSFIVEVRDTLGSWETFQNLF